MKKNELAISLIVTTLLLTLMITVKANAQTNDMKTFADFKMPGILIKVNATSETRPAEEITFNLSLVPEANVDSVMITEFNLTVYGYINGTDAVKIYDNSSNNFELIETTYYSDTFLVPEQVIGVTYGEIALDYNITVTDIHGIHTYLFKDIKLGFTMTVVEDIYRESLEEQLQNLRNDFDELNQTYLQMKNDYEELNQTYWQIKQDYESLSGVQSELDNTRTAVVILAVVTVFFVATTGYLVLRRPKNYW